VRERFGSAVGIAMGGGERGEVVAIEQEQVHDATVADQAEPALRTC
jgi:hypothetical protein